MAGKTTAKDRAPHGYGPDNKPLAPYGYNVDGTPRKSNRGARAGGGNGGGGAPEHPTVTPIVTVTTTNLDDKQRKMFLTELSDMFVTSPLAGAAQSKFIAKRLGAKHTMALAADAFVIDAYKDPIIDGLIVLNETDPSVLGWMDALADKAGYLLIAQGLMGMTKAIISNHRNPDPNMAKAGVQMARQKIAAKAAALAAEAAEAERAQAEAVAVMESPEIPNQREPDSSEMDSDPLSFESDF